MDKKENQESTIYLSDKVGEMHQDNDDFMFDSESWSSWDDIPTEEEQTELGQKNIQRRIQQEKKNKQNKRTTKIIRRQGNRTNFAENSAFVELLGKSILLTLDADQLNILGQTFRPIFCGTVAEVRDCCILLDPVTIKFSNAPFHQNPFPLYFPINNIAFFTPFDCDVPFSIS